MLYDSDPIMQGHEWNVSLFVRWILCMGERENFPNQPGTTMHNFLSNVNVNNHLLNDYSLCVSFSILQQSQKFWFSMFYKWQKQFDEIKTLCSLFKKNSHYTNERGENQIIKNQAISTQSTLSMKAKKIKRKPMNLLNANKTMQTKMFFQTNKQMRKTKHLTFNQSLVLNYSDTLSF